MNYSNTTTSVKQPNNFIKWLKNKKNSKYIILAVAFAAVGSYLVFRSFAATNTCSVINGATVCDVNMWVTGSVTGTGGEDTYLDTGSANKSGMFYGQVFKAPIKQAPGTVPVFRVKQNNTTYPSSTFHDWVTEPQKRAKESIYSQNPEGLVNEGVVFYAWDKPDAQPGTVPVYRLGCGTNGFDSTRYTTNLATANAYKVKQANGFVCGNTTSDPNYLPFIAFYAYPPSVTIKPYYVSGYGTGAANTYDPGRLINVKSVSSGDNHTCAVITGGTVKCWGDNYYGQLGDGTTTNRLAPTLVPGLTGVTSISVGSYHTCAVITGGTVKCWGSNVNGKVGDGTFTNRNVPTLVPGLTGVKSVSASYGNTCAVITGGTVKCWGDNYYGQLGDGTTTNRLAPTLVPGLTGVTSVSASYGNTCAVITGGTGGTVKCWGDNYYGQLGDGTTTNRLAPTLVPGLTGATSVSTTNGNTCAVITGGTGGTVKCWGSNSYGQLGDGTTTKRLVPTLVPGLTGVTSLVTNGSLTQGNGGTIGGSTCAVITGGTVKCWGNNNYGQLGDGTTTNRNVPTLVPDQGGVSSVSSGRNSTCAVITGGTVKCWGLNLKGQLGDGTKGSRNVPTLAPGLSNVASLSTGEDFTCAVITGGTVKCWGNNSSGMVGDGTFTNRNVPTSVPGLTGVTTVSSGRDFTCAVITGGTVKCWSRFDTGRGNPTLVPDLTGVTTVSSGGHRCAVITGGTVKCWGYNYNGQLGDGTTTYRNVPTLVPGLTGVTSVHTGLNHTCAVITGGTVKCWGSNSYGHLGDGTATDRLVPTLVPGLTGVVSIATEDNHTCAVITGGTVKCWGDNFHGVIGDGTTTNRLVPTLVPDLTGVTSVATGYMHTCAVITGGTVKCWGDNSVGELGDGTNTDRNVPTLVPGLTGVKSVATGGSYGGELSEHHTCAVITGGTVKCWGANTYGQLGIGLFGYRTYPSFVTSTVL